MPELALVVVEDGEGAGDEVGFLLGGVGGISAEGGSVLDEAGERGLLVSGEGQGGGQGGAADESAWAFPLDVELAEAGLLVGGELGGEPGELGLVDGATGGDGIGGIGLATKGECAGMDILDGLVGGFDLLGREGQIGLDVRTSQEEQGGDAGSESLRADVGLFSAKGRGDGREQEQRQRQERMGRAGWSSVTHERSPVDGVF